MALGCSHAKDARAVRRPGMTLIGAKITVRPCIALSSGPMRADTRIRPPPANRVLRFVGGARGSPPVARVLSLSPKDGGRQVSRYRSAAR